MICNDLSLAKKYLVYVGKNTLCSTNCLSNTAVIASVISGSRMLHL
jgi:hypothetical protein